MALMDLLTVGRSLSEARDRPHRFKLLNGALPKFGKPGAQVVSGDSEITASSEVENKVGKEYAAASDLMKTETIAEEKKQANSAPMHAFPSGRWTLNPFKAGPTPTQTVQGELSLDKVKPVRNDLSDSDLELITVAKRTEPILATVKVESVEVPIVKVKPLFERLCGLFRRAK